MYTAPVLDFYYRGRIGGVYSVSYVFRTLLEELVRRKMACAITPDDREVRGPVHETLRQRFVASPLTDRRAARVGISGCAPAQYKTHVVGVLRAAILNFEARVRVPLGPRTAITLLNLVLPSSCFSDEVLAANGVPASARAVLPHAIDADALSRIALPRAGRFTVLVVAANHARKNLDRCIAAFTAAFPDGDAELHLRVNPLRDDVPRKRFEIDMHDLMATAPANVRWLRDDVADLEALYRSAHAVFSLSSGEGFGLPLLEALAAGCLVIAPRYSGPLDFLSDENALLIDTKERDTPKEAQYLPDDALDPAAKDGWPDFDHAVALLRKARADYATLFTTHRPRARTTAEAHRPAPIVDRLVALCEARGVTWGG